MSVALETGNGSLKFTFGPASIAPSKVCLIKSCVFLKQNSKYFWPDGHHLIIFYCIVVSRNPCYHSENHCLLRLKVLLFSGSTNRIPGGTDGFSDLQSIELYSVQDKYN